MVNPIEHIGWQGRDTGRIKVSKIGKEGGRPRKNFEEIQDEVETKGFGRKYDEEQNVLISKGVEIALNDSEPEDFKKDYAEALKRFRDNDFADFYVPGEKIILSSAYGRYPTCYGEMVHVHREAGNIVVYWQFER